MVDETPELPFFAPYADEIDVDFGEPLRQSRVTVAFRGLLVLPHLVVVAVLGIVAVPLVVLGWFAALALGRLPRWIASYLMAVIAYATRVSAYLYMLAGQFPAFAISRDADYTVRVEIGASRLSRLKVFFRWLLLIPAWFVVNFAVGGAGLPFIAIVWLITLVRGRMPRVLFSALTAVFRYQARYFGYVTLVTDAYPGGLFDPQWVTAPDGLGRELQRLSSGARRVLWLIVILGIAVFIAGLVVPRQLGGGMSPAERAAQRLELASAAFRDNALACGQAYRCLEPKERKWAAAFDRFGSDLSGISFSASQQAAAAALMQDSYAVSRALLAASSATTLTVHSRAFLKADEELVGRFERDAKRLFGHGL